MTSTSWELPGGGRVDSAVGTKTWASPDVIRRQGAAATVSCILTSSADSTSYYLIAENFSFNIPVGSTIDGIEVSINKQGSNAIAYKYFRDNSIRLVVGGSVVGDNKADTATDWPYPAASDVVHGGVADKWGLTPTAAQINANDFGVAISVDCFTTSSSPFVKVGEVTIRVTYTSSGDPYTSTGATFPGTQATANIGGGASWTLHSNVAADDGAEAHLSHNYDDDGNANSLRLTNFGFSVPTDATILGVKMVMEHYATSTSSRKTIRDEDYNLVKAGVLQSGGDNKAVPYRWDTEANIMVTRSGGFHDLWGVTLTPADVNNTNFGVQINAANGDDRTGNAYIDYVTLEVLYEEAVSAPPQDLSPTGVTSEEAFGSTVLGLEVTPSGIASEEAVGSATLVRLPKSVSPSGISTEETFGSPSLKYAQSISNSGIVSVEVFGTPTLGVALLATGIPSAELFGAPEILQSTPWTIPTTAAVAGAGVSWLNPSNAIDPDLLLAATVEDSSIWLSNRLQATNVGWTIPSSSVITGITLRMNIEGSSSHNKSVRANEVHLLLDGALSTSDLKQAPSWDAEVREYGGPSELWGETWTRTNLLDADFGASIKCEGDDGETAEIQLIEMRASYQVVPVQSLDVFGIPSGGAFGTVTLLSPVRPTGIPSAEAFGSLSLRLNIHLAGIASLESVSTPEIKYDQSLAMSGLPTEEAFGVASVVATVVFSGISTAEAFGVPTLTVDQQISVIGISSNEAFGVYSVAGSQNLSPSGVASDESFGEVLLVPDQKLFATGVSSEESIPSPILLISIGVSGIGSVESFGTPTVSYDQSIQAESVVSAEAFGVVSASYLQDLTFSGIETEEGVGPLSVRLDVNPTGIPSGEAFGDISMYSPLVTGWVSPSLASSESLPGSNASWSTPASSLVAVGNSRAYSGSNWTSSALQATDLGWTIPNSVVILGIELRLTISADSGNHQGAGEDEIRILKSGEISTSNLAYDNEWGDEVRTYGTRAELWGESWTREDLLDDDFGAYITCNGDAGYAAKVHLIEMQVTYLPVPSQDFTAAGIPTAESVPGPKVVHVHELEFAGISTVEVFGTPTVRPDLRIVTQGIGSETAFGTAVITNYVVVSGIPTEEAFTAPEVTTYNGPGTNTGFDIRLTSLNLDVAYAPFDYVSASSIESLESFGLVTVEPLGVSISPAGIATAEEFTTTSFIQTEGRVRPEGILSPASFGSATVSSTYDLVPTSIPTAETFGDVYMALITYVNFDGVGVPSEEAFSTPTIEPGSVVVSILGLPSEEEFGDVRTGVPVFMSGVPGPTNQFGDFAVKMGLIRVSGLESLESFGSPAVASSISVAGVPSEEAFGSVDVVQVISPAYSIGSKEAFGSLEIRRDGRLLPSGIPSKEEFGVSSVRTGLVNFDGSGISTEEAFWTLSIKMDITVPGFIGWGGGEQFGVPTLTTPVTVGDGVNSEEAFGTPSVGVTLVAEGILSRESVGTPSIVFEAQYISAESVESEEGFGTTLLTTGSVQIFFTGISGESLVSSPEISVTNNIGMQGVGNLTLFGTPRISSGIAFSGISSSEAFGDSEVLSPATISVSAVTSAEDFGELTVSATNEISPVSIASIEAVGSLNILPVIGLSGIPSAESFGDVGVDTDTYIQMFSFNGDGGEGCTVGSVPTPEISQA